MAIGAWCRVRQHRLRLRAKGRRCTRWGNWKPTHRFVSQLRLRRGVLKQIIIIGLVRREKVDRKASVLLRHYIGHTSTLPGEADCSVERDQHTKSKTSLPYRDEKQVNVPVSPKRCRRYDDKGRAVKPQQKSGTQSVPSQTNSFTSKGQ